MNSKFHGFGWVHTGMVLLPLLYVVGSINGYFGSHAPTFAVTKLANGKAELPGELIALCLPAAYLLFYHGIRLIHVLASYLNGRVTTPRHANFCLEYASSFILVGYSLLFFVWKIGTPAVGSQYWAPISLVLLAALTVAMTRGKFLYGFKAADEAAEEVYEEQRQRNAASVPNGQSNQKAPPPDVARVNAATLTFDDIIGNSDIKRRMLEASRAITATRKAGSKGRNGILLHGGPGNGKTIFAEALAGELNLPFLQLTNTDIASQWVGERTVNVKAAFDQARRAQPCVLFIDEIDSLLLDRSGEHSSGNKEDKDLVNSLLTLLVDIRKERVVVIAATNYVDRLDGAAIREGRFDFKVEITAPDEEARIGLLRTGLKSNVPQIMVQEAIVRNVAQRWNGFSVKRILAVTEELPSYIDDMNSKGTSVTSLSFDDFMAALRRIQGRKGAVPENVKTMAELVLPNRTRNALTMIAGRLKDPVRVERLGGSMPTGVLFHGPAGTGKTTAVKALAKEVGSAFLISTGTDLARDPRALEKLYAQAMELRPTIIFIDEADDLLKSREYSSHSESTNKLLTLMDGVNDRVRDIVWIAATNHPDQIDAALLRGGRFTEKVEFELPSDSQLVSHISNWLSGRKIELASGATPDSICGMLTNESIANVEAVLQYAVNRAIAHTEGDVIELTIADVASGVETVLGR